MSSIHNHIIDEWPLQSVARKYKKKTLIKSRRGGQVALALQRINLLARPQDTRRIQNAKLVKCHFRFQVEWQNSRGQKCGVHCCRHWSKPQNPTTTEMRQPHKLSRPKQAQTLAKCVGQKRGALLGGKRGEMRTGVVRNVPHVASDALTHFKGAFRAPKWAERFKGRV